MPSFRPIYILFYLFIPVWAVGQNQRPETIYGLEFASHEVTKDLRTALNLNPKSPFESSDDFTVTFNISLKRLFNTYGYVVRIVANDSLNFDFVSSPETDEFHDFNLIINNKKTQAYFDYGDLNIQPLQWATVKIHFNTRKNMVSVAWNNKVKGHSFPVANLTTFRVFFGAHDFGKFKTSDVPPMIIKDIRINMAESPTIEWKLKEHRLSEVYDNTLKRVAHVQNPTWLIDRHTSWTRKAQFNINKYPSIAFNSDSSMLYASHIKGVTMLNIRTGALEKVSTTKGNVAYIDANQLLYVKETAELINYDLKSNVFSTFDFTRNAWDNELKLYKQPHYWHNNKFYNPFDSTLYTFGGYGYYVYKNKFQRYNKGKGQWEMIKTNCTIPPRYLSALGLTESKSKAYIFGGYGSESGKQELFPQSYYDLYTFNLNDHEVKKIWEFKDHSDEEIAFSNSLIVNEADSCFYVLSYPKNKYHGHLRLRRYGLNKPSYASLADSIPFQFHDEFSFTDLFLSEETHELIAVTAHKTSKLDSIYTVNVYTMYYPPLIGTGVLQVVDGQSMASIYWIVAGGTLLIAGLMIWRVKSRKQKAERQPDQSLTGEPALPDAAVTAQDPMGHLVKDTAIVNAFPEDKKIESTVFLFGDFQVFDKNGTDITSKFSTTLKELFVLLVLSSARQEKGISTTSLREHLWAEKDEVSARNNRNVNITKLRTIFEEIGDIKIENTHNYVRLVIGEGVFCDYQIASKILNSASEITSQTVEILLNCVKRGNLVSNLTASWLDSYKSDVSNKVIDSLLAYSQKLNVNTHAHLLLEIADTIFKYDSINQEALVLKCSILNNKGKYSLAKTWYDHFVKEYKALYAENYPKTFEQVISIS